MSILVPLLDPSASTRQRDATALIERLFLGAGFPLAVAAGAVVNAYAESGLNPKARNGSMYGLFQLDNQAGQGRGMTEAQLLNGEANTARILRTIQETSWGDPIRTAVASGERRPSTYAYLIARHIERPGHPEETALHREGLTWTVFPGLVRTTTLGGRYTPPPPAYKPRQDDDGYAILPHKQDAAIAHGLHQGLEVYASDDSLVDGAAFAVAYDVNTAAELATFERVLDEGMPGFLLDVRGLSVNTLIRLRRQARDGGTFKPGSVTVQYTDPDTPGVSKIRGTLTPSWDELGAAATLAAGMVGVSQAQRDMAALIEARMAAAGLPPEIIAGAIANAYAESGLNPRAIAVEESGNRSVGLFQLNDAPRAAGAGMSIEAREDPEQNIDRILAVYRRGAGNRLEAAYAAGERDIGRLAALWCMDLERPANAEAKGAARRAIAYRLLPTWVEIMAIVEDAPAAVHHVNERIGGAGPGIALGLGAMATVAIFAFARRRRR